VSFARYAADTFRKGEHDAEADAQLAATVGLLRSGLLKRFESSPYAFRRTLEALIRGHEVFLDALEKGRVVTTKFLREFGADDDTTLDELLASSADSEPANLYHAERLQSAVEADLAILRQLAASVSRIRPEHDPKLKALVGELEKIADGAEQEAIDVIDEAQKRKVILFSFFADTVKYVRDFLLVEVDRNPDLRAYRGRIAAVSGGDDLEEFSRQAAIYGFAPVSAEAPPGRDTDLYDILVSADVLAEGVNLQQCRHIINLDVPWNPMRLVQRHGRMDRISSTHNRVFLRTIFPAERLDQLLNLEKRILDKIARAAASIGVEAPVAHGTHGRQVFSETRDEIERLLREDPTLYERGGTAGAAPTGEEYRQTLRKALAENRDRIVNLPWKAGSGMAKGQESRVLFCAAVGPRTYLQYIRTDPNWQPIKLPEDAAIGKPGGLAIEGELGTCLRLAECEPQTPRVVPKSLEEDVIFDLWEVAQQDIWRAWMLETDPANLQPKVRPLNRRVADFIRANQPPEVDAARINAALDVGESPWPRREETMLREWFEDDTRAGTAKAGYLIDQILETGLEPFRGRTPYRRFGSRRSNSCAGLPYRRMSGSTPW
jgi:Helicase conserved C-terminal domain